ncbi:MAG: T9SS type A sorting domain-containing protein [Candidatus Kapaibacterium sp.]
MKELLITLLFLVPFVTFSNIWEKAKGPFEYTTTYSIFSFNDELFLTSLSDGEVTYKQHDDEWIKLDTGFFSDKGLVHVFNQKDNVIFTSTDTGIYLSYDYGDSWKHYDILMGNTRYEFVTIVDETIYLQANQYFSLHKLEKGSDTLEKVYTDNSKVDSIFADKFLVKDNYMFAADPQEHFDLLNKVGKLYISKDNGKTWKLSETMKEQIRSMMFYEETLLVFTQDDELYKSIDYGETWTTDTSVHIQASHLLIYKDLIFAVWNTLNVSSDGGESWGQLNDGIDRPGYKGLIISNGNLYFLTQNRLVYRFDYDRKYWNRISPMTDDVYQKTLIEERDTLFSTGSFTINYSNDKGESWDIYSESLYSYNSKTDKLYIRDSIIVAVNQWSRSFYISSDFGKTWRYENLGISDLEGWINQILVMGNRILLTSSKYGNFYSKDAGMTWNEYDDEVLKKDVFITSYVRLSDSEIILYSYEGLYLTNDNGLTWEYEKASEELKAHSNSMREGNNLYSKYSNNVFYKSTDLGRTWIDLEVKVDSTLNIIKFIFYNDYLILIASSDVYISNNLGKDWNRLEFSNIGPDGKAVNFRDGIIKDEYLILASSYGNWRAMLSDLGIKVKSSVESEIERNYLYTYPPYPNPAKSEVKMLFYWDINLPMTIDDINIYDITGKKIDAADKISLVKQESHYGNLIWDCSTVQPGIYLINIKHGTEEKAVKVVVE